MAKLKVDLPDDFTARLSTISDSADTVIEQALKAGGQAALGIFKSSLASAIGRGVKNSQSTGELISSLGVSPVDTDKDGNPNVKVSFNEPRREQPKTRGKRGKYSSKRGSLRSYAKRTNAMIANVLEYGRHNQPQRPFYRSAKSQANKQCVEVMKAEIERAFTGV